MSEIEVGDVVLSRGRSGPFYAVVRGVRLSRVVVERCDGRPSGPIAVRDVVELFKPADKSVQLMARGERLRPSPQMRLDLQ